MHLWHPQVKHLYFTFHDTEAVNSVDRAQNDPQLYLLRQISIQPSLSHMSYWHIAYLAQAEFMCCCHVSKVPDMLIAA
jgi:hypothetical protein